MRCYATRSESSDVSVYYSYLYLSGDVLCCTHCTLMDDDLRKEMKWDEYTTNSRSKMLHHLRAHHMMGDKVSPSSLAALLHDKILYGDIAHEADKSDDGAAWHDSEIDFSR